MRRTALLLLVLLITLSGCTGQPTVGATRLTFQSVMTSDLPTALVPWTEVRPTAPTVLASEQGDQLYLLVSLGDCSPSGRRPVVQNVSRSGPSALWVEVAFPAVTPIADPSPAIIRLRLADVLGTSKSGFTVQETDTLPIVLDLAPGFDTNRPIRQYVARSGYQCRVPIR